MKPQGGLTTVAGEKRREIRKWWSDNCSPIDVCSIYNNGIHVYTLDQGYIPGSFLAPPATLTFFPYGEVIRKIGKFQLIHRGHASPNFGGNAEIVIECNGQIGTVLIAPLSIIYIIKTKKDVLMCNSMGACLPKELLKVK